MNSLEKSNKQSKISNTENLIKLFYENSPFLNFLKSMDKNKIIKKIKNLINILETKQFDEEYVTDSLQNNLSDFIFNLDKQIGYVDLLLKELKEDDERTLSLNEKIKLNLLNDIYVKGIKDYQTRIISLMKNRKRIQAIKEIRSRKKLNLKSSKFYVECLFKIITGKDYFTFMSIEDDKK